MSAVKMLVSAHTDTVPGQNYTPESLLQTTTEVLNGNMGHYIDSVELISPELGERDGIRVQDVSFEVGYLKEHPPLEEIAAIRELIRDLGLTPDGKIASAFLGRILDRLFHSLNMINALNAVKVMAHDS